MITVLCGETTPRSCRSVAVRKPESMLDPCFGGHFFFFVVLFQLPWIEKMLFPASKRGGSRNRRRRVGSVVRKATWKASLSPTLSSCLSLSLSLSRSLGLSVSPLLSDATRTPPLCSSFLIFATITRKYGPDIRRGGH